MSAVRDDIEGLGQLYREPRPEPESLRVPPQQVEAEQAVLGGLMLDPRSLPKVADWLAEADFYREDHRAIYRAIVSLAATDKPFDWLTIGEWLEANQLECGRPGYVSELVSNTPSAANIVSYAEIVVEKARLRQAIELGTELVNLGFARGATADDLSALVQKRMAGLNPTRHTGLLPAKDGLGRWWEEMLARTNRPGLLGLPTPWKGLNDATKGLRGGRLYVLAGRPGMGKSVLGCQLASFTALRNVRTALFSLEMGAEEVHQRNMAALAEVPHDFLESPFDDSPHWSAVNAVYAQLKRAPLMIDDTPALSANQITARAERAHLQQGLGLIVVDHLHEMSVDPRDRVNALGDAARRLKGLAKDLDVPVVLLAQLNRANTRADDKRPTLTDLRASGSIEEVADVVLLIHREDYYHKGTHLQDVVELTIAKGRNIRSGVTINLQGRYDCMRADDWKGPLPQPVQPEGDAPKPKKGGWGKPDGKAAAAADARIRDVTGGN